jgi:hypothetical protein
MSQATLKSGVIENFRGLWLKEDIWLVIEERIAHIEHLIKAKAWSVHHVLWSVSLGIRRDQARFLRPTTSDTFFSADGRIRLHQIKTQTCLSNT